jgi:hypothetical protein
MEQQIYTNHMCDSKRTDNWQTGWNRSFIMVSNQKSSV